jgi:hypothetical protein
LPDAGVFLLGQHRIAAQAGYVVQDGTAAWHGSSVFQEDPLGVRGTLTGQ